MEDEDAKREITMTDNVLQGMRIVVDAFRLISVSLDLDETLKGILDSLKSLIDYDAAGIYVIEPDSGRLRSHIVRGYPEDVSKFEPISKGEGVIGQVLEVSAPVLIADVRSDPNYIEARSSTRSEIAAPIVGSGGRIIGVLNLESDSENAYGPIQLQLLMLFASGVAVAIEKATLHAEMMEKRRLESELAVARQVMAGLMPRATPRIEGFDIVAVNEPWYEVGGDYYDFIPIDDERWGIGIADVIGKGVPAALLVSGLRASLHSLARNELALRSIFNKANQFFRESAGDGQFVTLFYAELDVEARRMIYINAGHQPPLLLRRGGAVELLQGGGPLLGPVESPHYLEHFAQLESGDVLALYTDGITEAMDDKGNEYGRERLIQAISRARQGGAAAIVRAVVEDVKQFSQPEIADDRTLVVIKAL